MSSDIDHDIAWLEINRSKPVLVTLQLSDNDIRRSGLCVIADRQLGLLDCIGLDRRNEPIDQDEREVSSVVLEHDLINHDAEIACIAGRAEGLTHFDRDTSRMAPVPRR